MAWALNAMNVNRAAIEVIKASSLRMVLSPGELTTGKNEHTAPAMAMASRCGRGPAVLRRLHAGREMRFRFGGESDGSMLKPRYRAASPTTFSLVPVSGIRAAAFSPACTLGTVLFTSVIGRP